MRGLVWHVVMHQWNEMFHASAYTPAVLVRERLQGPTIHFLAKPFTRQELLGQVRAALSALLAMSDQLGRT
jgi:hypothetical protein